MYLELFTMIEISKKEILEYEKLKLLSQITITQEKIDLFRNKYKKNLDQFEKEINSDQENFTKYDDLIEWKAYVKSLKTLKNKLEELSNAKDIRIITKE